MLPDVGQLPDDQVWSWEIQITYSDRAVIFVGRFWSCYQYYEKPVKYVYFSKITGRKMDKKYIQNKLYFKRGIPFNYFHFFPKGKKQCLLIMQITF